MSVSDKKLVPAVASAAAGGTWLDGAVGAKCIELSNAAVPISQAGIVQDAVVIPFAFEVVRVEAFTEAIVATATVDVQIAGVSILTGAIVPVALTPTNGTLVAARTGRRGAKGATLRAIATTNGTGTLTDLKVRVWIRPYPMNGEV